VTPSVSHKIDQPSSSERILSTALELFAVKGYDATAVREICEAAGITKPTLYHFYGSKDGVLRSLVTTGFEHYRSVVNRGLVAQGSFRERLKIVARSVFQEAREHPRLWRFIHSIIWAPPGSVEPPNCTEFYDGVVGSLAAAAEEAVRDGELAPGPMEVRMLILMGSIGEAATGHVIAGRPELTDLLADQLVDTMLDGWTASAKPDTGMPRI
jgi:TetR/AcrR family transcriptional regulator